MHGGQRAGGGDRRGHRGVGAPGQWDSPLTKCLFSSGQDEYRELAVSTLGLIFPDTSLKSE